MSSGDVRQTAPTSSDCTRAFGLPHFDAIVVGAGFAGIYMLHRLRSLGLSVRVLEAGSGVGGTWYWNRYPGARCDTESIEYSYSFCPTLEQDWNWSEKYAAQPEILRYIEHVVDRFDLRQDIELNTRVSRLTWVDASQNWLVEADGAAAFAATFCVMATGCLSVPYRPELPGLESFEGDVLQTSAWPHDDVDLTGRRIGVIGTGSTGIQLIPELVPRASRVVVFQRSANFSVPARNAPLDPDHVAQVKRSYRALRVRLRQKGQRLSQAPSAFKVSHEEREREFERRWTAGGAKFLDAFSDLMSDERANDFAAEFVRRKIEQAVADRDVAQRLMPTDHPIGAKRLCVDSNYFETFNRRNVELVHVRRTPIRRVTPTGVETSAGADALDTLVFATGFDAITGALLAIDIRGRGGVTLRDQWRSGPLTHLGVMSGGFPNLFMITGPGSPSVLGNVLVHIEQHVEWIGDCIRWIRERGLATVEPSEAAAHAWMRHVRALAVTTLHRKAQSWLVGANIPGKPRGVTAYVGGIGPYSEECQRVVDEGYSGFLFDGRSISSHPRRRRDEKVSS